jgi:signal transduction histidine kinase
MNSSRGVDRQFSGDKTALWRDLACVAFAVLAAVLLFTHFEFNEWLFAHTRAWESMQVDEAFPTLIVLASCLCWFAWRRYREMLGELIKRRAAEQRLESLLLENRRLAQQYLRAQEAERKSIARELHDELGQYLNAIKTDAVSIQARMSGPPAVAVAAIIQHADHLHAVVRDLIRELRPIALDDLGLQAALEHYLDHCRQRLSQVQLSVTLDGDLDSLSEPLNLVIYRLTQEALTNVSRHARASHVAVRVVRTEPGAGVADAVEVSISDDGEGADPNQTHPGLGLIGMRERVDMLGGEWKVMTGHGQGFTLFARIPVGDQQSVMAGEAAMDVPANSC